jgi:hypothetical protein
MASTPPVDQTITPPTGFTASGTVAASGVTTSGGVLTSGTFAGPWYIVWQSLLVNFWRVPNVDLSTTTVALDNVAATHRVAGSHLIVQVNATYNTSIDYNSYNTPSWNQPQKFQFNQVSADSYGNSYGALNASCLGPRGQIVTTQNYYNRTPYVGAVSGQIPGINRSCGGSNFFCIENVGTAMSGTVPVFLNGHDDFEKYYHQGEAGSFLSDGDTQMYAPLADYYIGGQYATNTEDIYQIFQLIDNLGTRVTNSDLYSVSPAPSLTSNGWPVHDVGFSEYSISRHDYS